jgi:hypothetical protein
LIAALAWTTVVAEPAFARHLRSRAYSIVNDNESLKGAPDKFTCTAAGETADYVCQNTAQGFAEPLTEQNDGRGLLAANYSTDEKKTKLLSPTSFTCRFTGKAEEPRLPRKFSCDGSGQKFTLRDIAYVHPEGDDNVTYGLPCKPCYRAH